MSDKSFQLYSVTAPHDGKSRLTFSDGHQDYKFLVTVENLIAAHSKLSAIIYESACHGALAALAPYAFPQSAKSAGNPELPTANPNSASTSPEGRTPMPTQTIQIER